MLLPFPCDHKRLPTTVVFRRWGLTIMPTMFGQRVDEPLVAPLYLGARVRVARLVALEYQPGERPDVGDRRLPRLRDAQHCRGEVVGVQVELAEATPLRRGHGLFSIRPG